ncbi:MAG: hypothetical protein JXN59_08390 [Anaerolineae bacterium]|nr:hypothetical protein [Anaerolineae bacterium]
MHSTNRVVVIFVGLALLVAAVLLVTDQQPATAQYVEGENMQQLLINLWDQVMDNQSNDRISNFVFTVSFTTSISGLGNSVTFGQDLANLSLREAGEDYICVSRRFSRTTNVDCIPFTNITKISYSERE